MYVSEQTAERFEQVFKFMREEPRRFNMATWGIAVRDVTQVNPNDPEILYQDGHMADDLHLVQIMAAQRPPCGTVACLAGSALIVAGLIKPTFEGNSDWFIFERGVDDQAGDWLGIPSTHQARLYYIDSWPYKYRYRYQEAAPGSPEAVDVAIERFRYYIETGQ